MPVCSILIFTDGEGTPPLEKSRFPLLWIISPSGIVLNSKQLTALQYYNYREFRGEERTNKLNIPAQEVKETAFNATQKLEDYQKNTRNITNYCLSLLVAEEGSTGNLISRYVRSDAQRKGPPVGLENINVQQGLLPASNSLEDEISSLYSTAQTPPALSDKFRQAIKQFKLKD